MAHRAAPISVSIAQGQASANAVRATAGGWSTGSSVCLRGVKCLQTSSPLENRVSTVHSIAVRSGHHKILMELNSVTTFIASK